MSTGSRTLKLLSLLQTHRFWPGGELAARLDVSERTLRRDIDRLRELGYAIEAARGVAGGYQLRAADRMPPLLLDDDEAVAVAVGLTSGAAGAVLGYEEASVQALAKVVAMLPDRLRGRIEAVGSQTDRGPAGGPVIDAATLTTFAQCCRDREAVRFTYTAADGAETRRRVEPHRLVSLGRRWYLVAFDNDRDAWRSFRVDRASGARAAGAWFSARRVPGDDPVAFVERGFRAQSRDDDVRIRFHCPVEDVTAFVGRWGDVEPDEAVPGACILTMGVRDLHWPVMVLAAVEAPFEVLDPPQLAERVRDVARRFAA